MSKTATPCVFLDRDGTVIVERHYLSDPAQVELLPGAAEGLARLRAAGFALVLVTNQSGVARGLFTDAAVEAVHARLCELLLERGVELDGIYYCPHGPDDGCSCRKPAAGLVRRAARELSLDLTRSAVIGDKPSDIALGRACGIATVLVTTGYGDPGSQCPDTIVESLDGAADWLISRLT